MRSGAAGIALLGLLVACGGAGGGEATLGLDRQALIDRGLLSLTLEVYAGEDAAGKLVDCDRLLRDREAIDAYVSITPPQIVNLSGENAMTLQVVDLPPGIAFFLVRGHDAADGGGVTTHAGCGEGVIRRGEKTPVTVALRALP